MSDESHALSRVPPSPPAEDGDYDAIHAAVMETARGRWFLQEYAKRNRNADTRLVLEAIGRIEAVIRGGSGLQQSAGLQGFRGELLLMAQAIARTRSEIPEFGQGKPGPLPEHSTIAPAGDDATTTSPLSPDIFAAARRIREVSWTLRERGVEISTCDQIAALASSILGVSSLRNASDSRAQKLSDVLQHLERRIHAMLDGNSAHALPPHAATVVDVHTQHAAAEETGVAAAAATEFGSEATSPIEPPAEPEAKIEPPREPCSEIHPAAATAALEDTGAPTPLAAGIEQASATDAAPSVRDPLKAASESQAAVAEEIDASLAAPDEQTQPSDDAAELATEPELKAPEETSAEPIVFELEPLIVVPAGAGTQFAAEPVELELAPVAIIRPAAGGNAGPESLPTTQIEWGAPVPPVPAPAAPAGLHPTGQMDLDTPSTGRALADTQTRESSPGGDLENEMLALARAALPEPEPISPTPAAPPAQAGESEANRSSRKAPSDRLAAIKAMSENERIALFS